VAGVFFHRPHELKPILTNLEYAFFAAECSPSFIGDVSASSSTFQNNSGGRTRRTYGEESKNRYQINAESTAMRKSGVRLGCEAESRAIEALQKQINEIKNLKSSKKADGGDKV